LLLLSTLTTRLISTDGTTRHVTPGILPCAPWGQPVTVEKRSCRVCRTAGCLCPPGRPGAQRCWRRTASTVRWWRHPSGAGGVSMAPRRIRGANSCRTARID